MIVALGTDIVDVSRFAAMMSRTPGVAERLFTGAERSSLGDNPGVHRLAARFAAKEAVVKALGGATDYPGTTAKCSPHPTVNHRCGSLLQLKRLHSNKDCRPGGYHSAMMVDLPWLRSLPLALMRRNSCPMQSLQAISTEQ